MEYPNADVSKSTKIQRRNREEIIRILGGKCSECPWDDPLALVIDHVHSGGCKEYLGGGGGNAYYHRLLKHLKALPQGAKSDTYQLLCANHNMIKRYTKNEARGRLQHKRP
jgi:hypothetical protein